nr:LegC family aminotransferase [uncultured Acetatifactor sp.]
MIYLAEPNLSGNEKKYLNQCIDTTFVSSVGEFVTRFEEDICKVSEVKYGTAVSSGTAGLHMALRACGVGRDELVCIPTFTFIATANAVMHCGAEPWLIDIDVKSWTMNPEVLEEELLKKAYIREGKVFHKASGRRVGAIMPVYTLGMPADMDEINRIADRYNLPVIADAAAAIGARYKGENIGGIANATVYSFNGNKTITCGGGGAIVSNQERLIKLAKHLATTARCGIAYDHDMVGYNYRMTNLQAAVGCAQLERVEEFLLKKKYIRNFYNQSFRQVEDVLLFPEVKWADSACWFSGLVLSDSCKVKKLCEALKEKGIEAKAFWKPIHLQKPYLQAERSDMTISEKTWDRIITLPSSTGITETELEYVVSSVKELL